MTRKLEDLFNIENNHNVDEQTVGLDSHLPIIPKTLESIDKIEAALPLVRGLEASDSEMDDLAAKATESYETLMDLGMQVDSRYASEIFAAAGTMLGHAITAKTAKLNKKLKMIDLQLKKAKMDQVNEGEKKLPQGEGRLLSRNDLLKTLAARGPENQINTK